MNRRIRLAALTLLAAFMIAAQAQASAASVTISPLPGTPTALPGTQISFLGASAKALSRISVVGSSSGRHGGALRSYSSATGASFVPSKPFTPGEHVTVRATWATSATSASRAVGRIHDRPAQRSLQGRISRHARGRLPTCRAFSPRRRCILPSSRCTNRPAPASRRATCSPLRSSAPGSMGR